MTDAAPQHDRAQALDVGPIKVLVNDYAGHAFQIDLSNELARRGHMVTHAFCDTNVTPRGDLEQSEGGPEIVGISTGRGFDKYNILKRLGGEIRYGVRAAQLMRRTRPQVCINSNVPVASVVIITIAARIMRMRNVMWLQDFQAGLVAMSVGEKHPAARAARWFERWCVRRADHVVTISSGFEREVVSMGAGDRVTTIPNWAPIVDLPVMDKRNEWAIANGVANRTVLLYSGTLGLKHRPEVLVELARRLFEVDSEAIVLVVSESIGVEWIEDQRTAADPLANLWVLPFQPFEELPQVLGAADLFIALLDAGAGEFSVPSKVLSYLCAGRPVLGLMPAKNAASIMVNTVAEAGLVADDVSAFLDAGERLVSNAALRAEMGKRGRAFAESNFDIERITDRFVELFITESGQAA